MLLFMILSKTYQTGARVHEVSDLPSGFQNRTWMVQSDIPVRRMAVVEALEAEEVKPVS